MHVFGRFPVEERGFTGLLAEDFESGDQLSTLGRCEDADAFQRTRKSLRTADVGIDQAAVEIERTGETLKDFGGSFGETAAPEFHTDFFWDFFKDART